GVLLVVEPQARLERLDVVTRHRAGSIVVVGLDLDADTCVADHVVTDRREGALNQDALVAFGVGSLDEVVLDEEASGAASLVTAVHPDGEVGIDQTVVANRDASSGFTPDPDAIDAVRVRIGLRRQGGDGEAIDDDVVRLYGERVEVIGLSTRDDDFSLGSPDVRTAHAHG